MSRRRAAVLAAVLGVGAVGLLAAPPAAADAAGSTISCPAATGGAVGPVGSCATVTGTAADGTTQLQGNVAYSSCGLLPACTTVTLTVTGPGSATSSGSVAETPDLTGGSGTIPLTLPADAPNGTYAAALSGDGATATATFRLAVPPSPVAFGATDVSTAGRATLTWGVSAPTPATSYALYVDGRPTTVVPVCWDRQCHGTASGLSGGHVFQVVASRPGGDGAAALTSAALTTATVWPAPAGTPPGGGDTATGGAGTGGSGTVVGAAPSSGAPTASHPAGSGAATATTREPATPVRHGALAALPVLPPLSITASGGDGEPTAPGTYQPTLPYAHDLTVREQVTHPTALGHVADVVSDRTLIEALAAAVLLATAAAHLRVLARRSTADL